MRNPKRRLKHHWFSLQSENSGWKSSLFISKSLILIADGEGKLLIYNYESSENMYEWTPAESKIIYGMHITKEFYCEDNKSFYVFLYLLYKDGTIDIWILMINGELNIVDGTIKSLLIFQSPISMMMQIPKLEVLFKNELLQLAMVNQQETTGVEILNKISFLFEQIKTLDKGK